MCWRSMQPQSIRQHGRTAPRRFSRHHLAIIGEETSVKPARDSIREAGQVSTTDYVYRRKGGCQAGEGAGITQTHGVEVRAGPGMVTAAIS